MSRDNLERHICKKLQTLNSFDGLINEQVVLYPYLCNFCGKGFDRFMEYRGHLTTHVGLRPFCCDICGERFNHPVTLYCHHQKLHYQSPAEPEPEKELCADGENKGNDSSSSNCSTMSKEKISDQLIAENNQDVSTGENKSSKSFECDLCSKSFAKIDRLKTHISTVHCVDKSQICDTCGKVIGKRESMANHLLEHKKVLKSFKCSVCGKVYTRKSSLKKHKCIDSIHNISTVKNKEPFLPPVDEMSEETASFLVNITKAMDAIPFQPCSETLMSDQIQSELKRSCAINDVNTLITNTISDFSAPIHPVFNTEPTSCLAPIINNSQRGGSEHLPVIDEKTIDNILRELTPVEKNIDVTELFHQEISSRTPDTNRNQALKKETMPSGINEPASSLIDPILIKQMIVETGEPDQTLDIKNSQPDVVGSTETTDTALDEDHLHDSTEATTTQSVNGQIISTCGSSKTEHQVAVTNENGSAMRFEDDNAAMTINNTAVNDETTADITTHSICVPITTDLQLAVSNEIMKFDAATVDDDTIVDVCGETDEESVSSDIPEVLTSNDLPKALKSKDLPEVLKSNDPPKALKFKDLPEVLKSNDLPEAFKSNNVPEALKSKDLPGASKSKDHTINCSNTSTSKSSPSIPSPQKPNNIIKDEEKNVVIRRSKRKPKPSTKNSSKIFVLSNAKVNRPTFIIKTQPPSPTNDSEVPVVRTLKTWPSDNFIDSNNHNGLFVNKPQQLPCIDQTTLHYSSSMTVGDTVSIQPPAISQHCKICNEGFVNDTSAFQMHLRGHMKDCKIIARKCGVIRM